MARFSERVGAKPSRGSLQLNEMDKPLRNSLWNVMLDAFNPSGFSVLAKSLARNVARVPVDTVPTYEDDARRWVRDWFFLAPWHEVYDIIEYSVTKGSRGFPSVKQSLFESQLNQTLDRELAGYRLINGVLCPISDPAEVTAIAEAGDNSLKFGIKIAHEHITTSVALLGLKPHPDYRNSIKESISAVEAVVNTVAGTDGNGVAGALDSLKRGGIDIHGAFDSALRKLYGFSSDSSGIRHALIDDAERVGYDEAKFMLVACSAFVNFIIAKADAAGLLRPAS